jgi:putative ABC transport system permease protein
MEPHGVDHADAAAGLMATLREWIVRLWGSIHPNRGDRELEEELRLHLELSAEDVSPNADSSGVSRTVRVRTAGVAQAMESLRDQRGLPWLDDFWRDSRFAVRTLVKNPGFALVVIFTLALGIGANTTIFSVAHAVLFQGLPYPEPDRLVAIVPTQADRPSLGEPVSYPTFRDWQDQAKTFEAMAGYVVAASTLTGRGEPSIHNVAAVTPGLFAVLRSTPLLGRMLIPEDGREGAPRVVVSEGFWRHRLGQDSAIIGQSLTLDGAAYSIVGVMPSSFRFPHGNPLPAIWMPLTHYQPFQQLLSMRMAPLLNVVGRLARESSASEAQSEMETIVARLAQQYPADSRKYLVAVQSLQDRIVGDTKSSVVLLLGAVGLLLLMACTNVASLQVARMLGRAREMAIRAALGAGWRRLFRQILTESLLLTVAGGTLGLVVAQASLQGLTASMTANLPEIREVHIDRWVLAFTFGLSCLTGVFFALLPMFGSIWRNLREKLTDIRMATEDRHHARTQNLLVILEVAVAVVMLTSAGLLVRSLLQLQQADPGFNAERLLTATISLPQSEYPQPDQWLTFNAELLSRIQRLPGVQRAGLGVGIPFIAVPFTIPFTIEGRPPTSSDKPSTALVEASPDYFAAMQIPVVRGRPFADSDTDDSTRVAIVNQAFTRRYFGDDDAVGQHLLLGDEPRPLRLQIVGVVRDTVQATLVERPPALLYLPFAQRPFWVTSIVVRTATSPESLVSVLRAEVFAMAPTVAVWDTTSMETLLARSFASSRDRARLLGLLGLLALALAAIGIYGVLTHAVTQRKKEIGIRMALGARRGQVVAFILRHNVGLAVAGIGTGIVGAAGVTRWLEGMLFEVTPLDPTTFVLVTVVLAAVAGLAAYIPARAASRVDPLVAIRCE